MNGYMGETMLTLRIKKFGFGIGWYSGEPFKLLSFSIFTYQPGIAWLTILEIQIVKFNIHFWFEPI